jgi:hypothetical protein
MPLEPASGDCIVDEAGHTSGSYPGWARGRGMRPVRTESDAPPWLLAVGAPRR